MVNHTEEEYNRVMELYSQGFTYYKISKNLGIPLTTTRSWVKENTSPMKVRRWSEEEEGILRENYHKKRVSEILKLLENRTKVGIITHAQKLSLQVRQKKKQYKEVDLSVINTPNFGYIIGVLLGDGFIRKRGYSIGLSCIDKEFADYFSEKIKNLLGVEMFMSLSKRKEKNHHDIYSVGIKNKKFAIFLNDYRKDFSWIYQAKKEVKLAVLKGLFDSEGSMRKNVLSLRFHVHNKSITKLFFNLSRDLGFNPQLNKSDEITINGYPAWKFYNQVGITIKRKSERVEGFRKIVEIKEKQYEIYKKVMSLRHRKKWGESRVYKFLKNEKLDVNRNTIRSWIYYNTNPLRKLQIKQMDIYHPSCPRSLSL